MATGYTADVANGKMTDWRDFVLMCSRGMVARIMERDNSMSNYKYTPQTIDEHHIKSLGKARRELDRLNSLNDRQWQVAYTEDCANKRHEVAEAKKESQQKLDRYNYMLAHVLAWNPPTPDHENFKKFMIEQLEDSINWDCSSSDDSFYERYYTVHPSVEEYRAATLSHAQWELDYAKENLAKQQEIVNGRNKWMMDLLTSLDIDNG